MCLAHQIPSETERAYRRKDLLKKREACLKDWEAYCLTGKNANCYKTFKQKGCVMQILIQLLNGKNKRDPLTVDANGYIFYNGQKIHDS